MKAKGTVISALVALLLGGCAVLTQPPPPPDTFFRLRAPAPERSLPAPALPGVVEVVRFTADGLTAERALVYAEANDSYALGSYAYHLWTDSPTALLQEALVDYLRQAGVAERVVTPNLRLQPDYIIQGHIRRFEQVIGPVGAPAEAVVEVELAVTDRRSGELVLLRTYEARRRVRNAEPQRAIQALGAAVAEVYDAFVADLAALGTAGG